MRSQATTGGSEPTISRSNQAAPGCPEANESRKESIDGRGSVIRCTSKIPHQEAPSVGSAASESSGQTRKVPQESQRHQTTAINACIGQTPALCQSEVLFSISNHLNTCKVLVTLPTSQTRKPSTREVSDLLQVTLEQSGYGPRPG